MSESSRLTTEIKQYDIDMFEPAPDVDLLCPICRLVLTAPLSTPCGHSYCSTCISRWLDLSVTCPTCRTPVDKADLQPADARLVELISLLTMHCPFSSTGCDNLIQIDSYETHLLSCPFELLNCRWKPCRMDLLRRDKAVHEMECDWRKERCPRKCQLMICIKELDTHDCKDKIFENVEKLRAKLRSKQEAMAQLESRVHELKVEKTRLELRLQEINDNITEIHSRRAQYLNQPLPPLEGEPLPPLEGEALPALEGEPLPALEGGEEPLPALEGEVVSHLAGGEPHLAGEGGELNLAGDLHQLPATGDAISYLGGSGDVTTGSVRMENVFHVRVVMPASLLGEQDEEDVLLRVEEEVDLQPGVDVDLIEETEGSYDFHGGVEDETFVPLEDDSTLEGRDVQPWMRREDRSLEDYDGSTFHPRQEVENLTGLEGDVRNMTTLDQDPHSPSLAENVFGSCDEFEK